MYFLTQTQYMYMYSETCKIRKPLEGAKSFLYSEVSSFQGAIRTVNSTFRPEVTLSHRMSSFRRVTNHLFHCKNIIVAVKTKEKKLTFSWLCRQSHQHISS
jgi:hypothetical protein